MSRSNAEPSTTEHSTTERSTAEHSGTERSTAEHSGTGHSAAGGRGTGHRAQHGAERLWDGRTAPARGRKPSLTLERIADAAIAIADTDGIDALSLQRLAGNLSCGTMSLYRYVRNKDELVALMLDTAIGEPRPTPAGADWRSALTHWAHQGLRVFERHPWALPLVTTPRVMGPNETRHLEQGLRAVSEIGLRHADMLDTVLLVNAYVRGMAPTFVNALGDGDPIAPHATELAAQHDRHREYPTLMAVMKATSRRKSTRRGALRQFNHGLQRVLDGIAADLSDT